MPLYNHVIIVTVLVSIYSAESTPNRSASPAQSHDKRFVRQYYKYNLKHDYTTFIPYDESYIIKKPRNRKQLPKSYQLINYHNIQYAPLPLKSQELHSNQFYSTSTPQDDKAGDIATEANTHEDKYEIVTPQERDKKSYIVPKLYTTESSEFAPRKYIPGYKVDMQLSNSNVLVKNKQVNINLLQPQANYNNKGVPQNKAKTKPPYSMLPHPQNINTYDGNIRTKAENNNGLPFFYVKASKLQLNPARDRNVARAHRKASVDMNSSFRKFPSFPQEFFSDPKSYYRQKSSNSKTP